MRHVKINGIWYRLAEDAEGQHYAHNREPLRPPNAQLVQGDSTDFQLRPDSLLWRITDWSGGEGQLKWTTPDASRSYLLQGVDPFSRPGSLQLGYLEDLAEDGSASDAFTSPTLVLARDGLFLFSIDNGTSDIEWSEWSVANQNFGSRTINTNFGDNLLPRTFVGDASYIYSWNDVIPGIIRWDETTVATLNDQVPTSTTPHIVGLDSYLYALWETLGELYEVSKITANTTTPEVALYEFNPGEVTRWSQDMTVGDGKVYFFTRHDMTTVLHEVVPSSAAGSGYGRVLTEINGFRAESLWFAAGTLFLVGTDSRVKTDTPVGVDRQIFYVDPQGQYGTLGSVRGLVRSPADHGIAIPEPNTAELGGGFPAVNSRLTRTGIAIPPTSEDQDEDDVQAGLFEVDSLSGGYAAVGRAPSLLSAPTGHRGMVFFDNKYFLALHSPHKVVTWDVENFTAQVGMAVSPAHDFNLASTKILDAIEVSCEPLPASCVISIGYSLDGATWVDTNVVTTTGATSGTLAVSTDSSTKTFNNLQVRVKLTGSGGNSPVIRSIDTFARVNRKINTWDLLLDISDDSAPQGYSGQQILDNLLAVGDNTVIDFVDRYGSHVHDSAGDQYDVVIDAMSAVLSQPGEGVVAIRILETV